MLFIADWLEQAGHTNYWQLTFLYLCGFVCLANIGLMLIPEASASSRIAAQKQAASGLAAHFGTSRLAAVGGFLVNTVWGPLGSFFRKNGLSVALTLLGFIFLFKIGEAFMGKMSLIFYKEIGFSKSDIALYSKGLGWVTTVAFTILGAFWRSGPAR